jgi:hypothetical protein
VGGARSMEVMMLNRHYDVIKQDNDDVFQDEISIKKYQVHVKDTLLAFGEIIIFIFLLEKTVTDENNKASLVTLSSRL